MKTAERLWYRRLFNVPKDWAGQRVLLHFGAVDWEATVWVNGKQLGTHQGGYDGFSFDVTDALKPEGEQELIVGVWDPSDGGPQPRGKQVRKPGGIYYTPSTGIWQTVWLEPVPAAAIAGLKIVPDLDTGSFLVTVQTRGEPGQLRAAIKVTTPEAGGAQGEGPAGKPITVTIPPRVHLWTPEDPFLYDLDVQLLDGGKAVDRVTSYAGMRRISIGKDAKNVARMHLNGKPIFQVGPLDQGFWPDGLYTAPTDAALKFDVEITKKLGFNMTRKHVKVEPERWYYWCDKLGLLVWQDMPSGDKSMEPGKGEMQKEPKAAAQFQKELGRMIEGRYNHPCIVLWVVFNEGWGQFDTQRLTPWVKEQDPTRLVTCASGWNDFPTGDAIDAHIYPGPGMPKTEPGRAAVLGEFGGLALKVDGHTWTKETWGYQGTADRNDLTRKYERMLAEVWKLHERGLSAAVYTQLTDVETEANGLLTYDREVIKVDEVRTVAVNRGDLAQVPAVVPLVPTANLSKEPIPWRYTTQKPADGWEQPGFNPESWSVGRAGFGSRDTANAVVNTEWRTADIWIRRDFDLPADLPPELYLFVHHDDDARIFLNGVLAAELPRWTTAYEEVGILPEARKALKPGKNVLAVHCHQTTGAQYIDAGLVTLKPRGK
jgi:hypothetical protein